MKNNLTIDPSLNSVVRIIRDKESPITIQIDSPWIEKLIQSITTPITTSNLE